MDGILLVIIFSCLVIEVSLVPVRNKADAQKFLKKFGYMGSDTALTFLSLWTDDQATSTALTYYQTRMGITVTGKLDIATINFMNRLRCGVKDVLPQIYGTKRRQKRFANSGLKWPTNSISYKFLDYTADLDLATIERVFADAFKMWSDVSSLQFVKLPASDTADIDIKFARLEHGDGADNAFDGPGGVLAHAFYPTTGNVHFDDDETFTDKSSQGINLLYVAVHELGHSLGLGHSETSTSIMFPTYRDYNPNLQLDSDDIAGIQDIYGSVTLTTTTTNAPSAAPEKIRSSYWLLLLVVCFLIML